MTSIDTTHSAPTLIRAPIPARCSRRIQALAIDLLVQGATLIALMSLLELLGGHRPRTGGAFAGWLILALLYEPALVTRYGATLGHMASGLRVTDPATGGTPDPVRAFARFWLKATSGAVALLFLPVMPQHRALHDIAAGTCVEES